MAFCSFEKDRKVVVRGGSSCSSTEAGLSTYGGNRLLWPNMVYVITVIRSFPNPLNKPFDPATRACVTEFRVMCFYSGCS